MISNYYTFLSLLSTFHSSFVGKRIREVYTQDPDEICIAFHDEPKQLVCVCRPDLSTAYLHDGRTRARRNSVDLLGGCIGARLTRATLVPFDRVLHCALDNGTIITIVLFGPAANVFLLDASGVVLDSFKNPKKLRGSQKNFPPVVPPDGFPAFRAGCAQQGPHTVVATIRKAFPALGRTLALEAVNRAGIDAALKGGELDTGAILNVENAIREVIADLGTPIPRVYVSPGGAPEYFSLVPLRLAAALREETFSDISKAIRFFIAGRGSSTEHEKEKDSIVAPIRQQIEKGRRTLRAIAADAREAERADTYEEFGARLMAGLPALARGLREYETEIRGENVTIPLDPALSPVQNAQRYFEKAKRARAAGEESARRMIELSARVERLEKLLDGVVSLPPGEGAERFAAEHAAELDEVGLGPRARERESLPFRVFTVDGGFEVLAGKNGANNDLLTLRYAKPDDLWFHARGGSGSHVVLRVHSGKGDPGKKACEQAAGIAAYYSKMKNSGTVAVAMTEKRYVRKPRGAPAGTVMIEREKVIFARPVLPREAGI